MANSPTSNLPSTPKPMDDRAAVPDLGGDAKALLDEARSAAGKVADETMDQVEGLAERAKGELSNATDKAKSMASDQKDMLAEQIGGVADAVGRAASDLEQSNGPSAHYARMIADNAEKLSTTIRDSDVDQLLGMAQDFGRRQPALFVGAAALLGFAASRFVMASAQRRGNPPAAQPAGSTYREFGGTPASNPATTGGNTDVAR